MATMAATVARVTHCKLQPAQRGSPSAGDSDQVKIVLQPRLCTLRSYAPESDRAGVVKTTLVTRSSNGELQEQLELTPFLSNLYEYIESSKRSQDFEIITGRIAMMIFAATIGVELTTGNSVFKKMDMQGIVEGLGACFAAVVCAAVFAYSSRARKEVGRIFTIGCNSFIDAFIDQIVDGLFYEIDVDESSNNIDNL